jgi:hypothetical protein
MMPLTRCFAITSCYQAQQKAARRRYGFTAVLVHRSSHRSFPGTLAAFGSPNAPATLGSMCIWLRPPRHSRPMPGVREGASEEFKLTQYRLMRSLAFYGRKLSDVTRVLLEPLKFEQKGRL